MKRLKTLLIILTSCLIVLVFGCSSQKDQASSNQAPPPGEKVITDMAGRSVTIGAQVKKVYAASPVETIVLYSIDPDLMVGWSYHMVTDENSFIPAKYRDLPVLGSWADRSGTAGVEEILKVKPDLILMAQDRSPQAKEFADEVQELTKIPVFVISTSLEKIEEAYRLTGKALNREEQANKLADYCQETIREVKEKKQLLAGREPVRVYYAEGPKGLETEPRGSWHAEVIEFVGGVNAADSNLPKGSEVGRSPVSLEQIFVWDPEVILITYFLDSEQSSFPQIVQQSDWRNIRAVKEGRVYEIPYYPFNWFDRPPSVNRLIGIKWLSNLLYPDVYPMDLRAEVKRFYSLFYHYDLSEQELDALLKRAQNSQK